jgi:hypothetical protein
MPRRSKLGSSTISCHLEGGRHCRAGQSQGSQKPESGGNPGQEKLRGPSARPRADQVPTARAAELVLSLGAENPSAQNRTALIVNSERGRLPCGLILASVLSDDSHSPASPQPRPGDSGVSSYFLARRRARHPEIGVTRRQTRSHSSSLAGYDQTEAHALTALPTTTRIGNHCPGPDD